VPTEGKARKTNKEIIQKNKLEHKNQIRRNLTKEKLEGNKTYKK
jgi:hypothetical protein